MLLLIFLSVKTHDPYFGGLFSLETADKRIIRRQVKVSIEASLGAADPGAFFGMRFVSALLLTFYHLKSTCSPHV